MRALGYVCLLLSFVRAEAAPKPVSSNAVVWFEIGVTHLKDAREFYGSLFGWEFEDKQMSGYHFDLVKSDGKLIGELNEVAAAPGSGTSLYFPVSDLRASFAKARALGATVGYEPMNIPGTEYPGSIAMVRDPDGNPIGLYCAEPLPSRK